MAHASQEPQRFGKYQILERIAAGGMAEVFKARLDGIGGFHRTFAIKRILPHLSSNPEFVDMLVDEAKVAGLLSHANIVQILDLGAVDQQYYIAMEYVNGRDLGQLLQRCKEKNITLPVPHAVFLLIEMLKGLEYAHNRQVMRGGRPVPLNIVHRDISPANVLVSLQGEVKLTDFGIAKASVKALETMSGVVKGRYDYMSPEQASGNPVDQRSDLFSAGVVFYQLLTGQHPFRQPTELGTIEAIRRGQFLPPSEVNPDVPPALDRIVASALATRAEQRYQSATAFKEALEKFFHDAGFIFTAPTLAGFLRGLFPETEGRPAERAPSPDRDDVELEELSVVEPRVQPAPTPPKAALSPDASPKPHAAAAAAPAQAAAAVPAQAVAAPAPTAAVRPPPPPRALAGLDEGPTVVQTQDAMSALHAQVHVSNPPLAEEATLIRPNPASEWGDVATVIRPPPDAGANSTPISAPKTAGSAGKPARPSAPSSSTPSFAVHAIWFMGVLLAGVVGLLLGMVLSTSFNLAEPVVVQQDPLVEIHFPEGSSVQINGEAVMGSSPLRRAVTANQLTRVQLLRNGTMVAEIPLTLQANELRVVSFSSNPVP